MNRIWISLFVIAAAITALVAYPKEGKAQAKETKTSRSLNLKVEQKVIAAATKRVGVNLGTWTLWGAGQLCRNVLMNPGFEGKFDRIAVIVTKNSSKSFSNERGLGDPDGYWKGASYNIRSGKSAGKGGTLLNSLLSGFGNLPQYMTEKPLPPLETNDVVMLSKEEGNPKEIGLWWIPNEVVGNIVAAPGEARPGSRGKQSAKLTPQDGKFVEIQCYLDAIGDRAGKLLVVNGTWKFSLWAKGESENNSVHINLTRLNGGAPFISKTIDLTNQWKEYSFEFTAADNGPPGTLKLGISAQGPDSSNIWIDDIFLGTAKDNGTAFRDEAVNALRKLRPSFIRDYQGQMGDSAANRIADLYARKAFRYRQEATQPAWRFCYSIPDLLNLCRKVEANPWIVLPTTLSDDEIQLIGRYLAVNAGRKKFSEVYVEFGNENWNWLFRPTGIPYPGPCGAVADRAFRLLKKAAGKDVNLKTVIQGQYAVPEKALEFGKATPAATTLAVAPYFLFSLEQESSVIENMEKLFDDNGAPLATIAAGSSGNKQNFAVYEVNLHTKGGSAPSVERSGIVAGAAAGTALAKRLIQGARNGAAPQMVFSLTGFDTTLTDVPGYVRLWGIVRDLSPTNRFRPTGLATALVNHAFGGSLHDIVIDGNSQNIPLTMAAFRTKASWKAVIASEHGASLDIALTFPDDNLLIPTKIFLLKYASPLDTNEDDTNVRIVSKPVKIKGRTAHFTIPAWGLVVFPSTTKTAEK